MFALLLIICCVVVAMASPSDSPASDGVVEYAWPLHYAVVAAVGALLAPLAFQAGRTAVLLRRVDRFGDGMALIRVLRAASLSRIMMLVAFGVTAMVTGYGAAVRRSVGSLILLDEAAALLPMLGALVLSWRLQAPADRRLRDAMLIRDLDHGGTVRPWPGNWRFAALALRQHAGLVLVPVALIGGWRETIDRFASPGWSTPLDLVGVLVVLAFSPWIMRWVWSTVPLGRGPLYDLLADVGRVHRVRLGGILVWRTLEPVFNAAVLGMFPRLRYVLLSEPLLERLPERELVAVVAHEVAHAKCHHAIRLLVGAIGAAGCLAFGVEHLADWIRVPATEGWSWVLTAAVLIGAGLVFGLMSRVFERQADAFAASHLSAYPVEGGALLVSERDGANGRPAVTREAASTMARALGRVTELNGLRPDRFSFRHGSIDSRRRSLERAVGADAFRTPADRAARRITLVGVLLSVLSAVLYGGAEVGFW